jgi:arginine utilization regulatory protein
MLHPKHHRTLRRLFPGPADFKAVFDQLGLGVTITDRDGDIIYYNRAQAEIDELDPEFVLGRPNLAVYEATSKEPSVTMTVHETLRPVTNFPRIYYTRKGKCVNSTHSVYPLFAGEEFLGSLCLIQGFQPGVAETIIQHRAVAADSGFARIVTRNPGILKALEAARLAAAGPSPVLIQGPTGSGKELFARGIHAESPWRQGRYVSVNCAAIPGNLLEGVLFGTTRGAFTGAVDQAGLFEEAEGGVFFLDELDSMPPALQPKLLRVLEEMKVRRLGATREKAVNFKLIATVSERPTDLVRQKRLRADLFYRLGVVVIALPPLRERPEDLEPLVTHFLDRFNRRFHKCLGGPTPEVWAMFRRHAWPGNVRELEHLIEGAVNLAGESGLLGVELLPEHFLFDLPAGRSAPAPSRAPASAAAPPDEPEASPDWSWRPEDIRARERAALVQALAAVSGSVTLAARLLGIKRQVLTYRMKKYGLHRRDFRPAEEEKP